jgi:hypothetical protein
MALLVTIYGPTADADAVTDPGAVEKLVSFLLQFCSDLRYAKIAFRFPAWPGLN